MQLETFTSEQNHKLSSGKGRKLLFNYFAPLALYLLGAIVFTWPLVLNLGDKVINPRASSSDVWQHLWNSWWMRFSLLDLRIQPYYNPLIFWPNGANLYYHALAPLDGYASVPFQLLFGLVTAFNLIFFLQLMLAGFAAYCLARYLTGNYAAALVAGVIYAFSPLESILLNLGQVELTSIAWLPFYMLFFIKTLERAPRPWLNRIAAVFFLLITAIGSWYYALYALLFSGLYLLYRLWKDWKEQRKEQKQDWREWAKTLTLFGGVLAVWLILISPLLIPTIREVNSGGNKQDLWKVAYNSADVLGFIRPGASIIWGIFGFGSNSQYRGNFVGLFAFGLAALGLITSWRKSWFWAIFGLVFGVLALGPVLHFSFDPNWNKDTAIQGLPLPGQLLYNLPFGNIARVPLRYGLGVMLALSICAAFGLDWLDQRLRQGKAAPALSYALPILAGGLIFLEFLPIPRTLVETRIPAFYQQIHNEGKWNDFAVLEMPDEVTTLAMYYQTMHQHPILNAYLSRPPVYNLEQTPGIKELRTLKIDILTRDILNRESLKNIQAVLAYNKIRYVILHPAFLDKTTQEQAQEVIQAAFGNSSPYFEDSDTKVWRVPEIDQNTANASKILPAFGNGWGNRENGPNNEARRAINSKADLMLFNPYQKPLSIEINSTVQSFGTARNLQILLNEQAQISVQIGLEPTPLKLRLTLSPGLNRLGFQADGSDNAGRKLWFGPLIYT